MTKRLSILGCTTRLVAVAVAIGSLGCSRGESIETVVLRCAELNGAKKSQNADLRRLLAQAEHDRGLPKQLDTPLPQMGENGAVRLAQCFPGQTHALYGSSAEDLLEDVLTEGPGPSLGEYLGENRALVVRVAEAVDTPVIRFGYRHAYGYFGSLGWLDDASLGSRLLLLRAIDSAQGGDAAPAEADLLRALRLVRGLSLVDRIESRVLASTLRSEALRTASLLLNNGLFRRDQAGTLYSHLRDTLSDWPPDKRMLIGDRAMVLHAYEAIREGLLERLLTGRERADLERRGAMAALEAATAEQIDSDEALYLDRMARLIAASEDPYYARITALEQTTAASSERLFAERVFLIDLADSQQAVARDRARCEAWVLALAAAGGFVPAGYVACPTSGSEYQVRRESGTVSVTTGDARIIDPVCPEL